MTPADLCAEATRRGLRLEPRGDKLAVIPASRCSSDFAAMLRQYKPEVLALLENRAADLPDDCVRWLHIARQILAGEFDGAERSTRESLDIGLRSLAKPEAREALKRLGAMSRFK